MAFLYLDGCKRLGDKYCTHGRCSRLDTCICEAEWKGTQCDEKETPVHNTTTDIIRYGVIGGVVGLILIISLGIGYCLIRKNVIAKHKKKKTVESGSSENKVDKTEKKKEKKEKRKKQKEGVKFNPVEEIVPEVKSDISDEKKVETDSVATSMTMELYYRPMGVGRRSNFSDASSTINPQTLSALPRGEYLTYDNRAETQSVASSFSTQPRKPPQNPTQVKKLGSVIARAYVNNDDIKDQSDYENDNRSTEYYNQEDDDLREYTNVAPSVPLPTYTNVSAFRR